MKRTAAGGVGVVEGEKKITRQNKGGNAEERLHQRKAENIRLRECVLTKLWDSLPPDAQTLRQSDDEDLESDATESGLEDEEDDCKLEGLSLKKGGKELLGHEIEATTQSHGIIDSDSCEDEEYDSSESWGVNFDFIQAVICLKSTTSKLQRVPADDVLKIFKNQWVLSRDIKSSQSLHGEQKSIMKRDFSISGRSPIHRKRLKNLNYETKHREHDDLISNRSTNNFNLTTAKVVIPETDESETSSLESSPIMAKRTYPVLDLIEFQSTVDSGFYSEKPESAEINTEPVNCIPLAKSGYLNEINRKAVSEIKKRGRTIRNRKYLDPKQPDPSISSESLNYVLRSSECNELLVRSVKAILNGLKGIEHSASSLRVNWHGSVQQEGIEAIVNVVNQLEKEKGSNSCRDEAAAAVGKVLQNMLYSNENNMRTTWEHHGLLILELCNAFSVCTEVVNFLISEVGRLIPVVQQTSEKNMRMSLEILDKSYLLFHSLKIVLKKYAAFPESHTTRNDENKSPEKVPDITTFWKRHFTAKEKDSDIFVTGLERLDNHEGRKEDWIWVLEELVVASTTTWPVVKVLAWQCLNLLKSPHKSSTS